MTVFGLGILGWLTGLVAYLAALALLYRQSISRGDLGSVVFSSLLAFAICYWLLYLPILGLARRWLPRSWMAWSLPVIGVLLGLLPTALIARFWGGSFRALLTPEALLFMILFTTVGLVVGAGFVHLKSR